jgi:hypothetical protein
MNIMEFIDRRKFLSVLGLGLAGCKCELDNMKIRNKYWWEDSTQSQTDEFTNANGQQGFLLIGDSIARGNSTAPGPTPTAGTVYQWNATSSQIVEVGANDLVEVQADGTNGSQWPKFGIDYYTATGKKPVFCCTGIGGGHFYTAANGGALSWYTNGSLYSNAVTKANNCLNALGTTKFKAVFIIMGYNDVANNTGTNYSHLTSLITRINTDFNTPRIIICFNNKQNATADNTLFPRQISMKKFIRQLSYDYTNVELGVSLETLEFRGSYYQVDNAHLNYDGNFELGELLARQTALSTNLHRHTRFILGSYKSVLSNTRQNLINSFVESQSTAGNLQKIDALYWFKNPLSADCVHDWMGLTSIALINATFNVNSDVQTNGTTTRIATTNNISRCTDKALPLSDIILGARISTNTDGLGNDGALFGVREGASQSIIDLAQGASDLQYRLASTSVTTYTSGDDYFVNDTFHAMARNGSTVSLIKSKTVIDSATVASSTLQSTSSTFIQFACRNNNGTIDRYFGGKFIYGVVAKYSDFNLTSFHDEMETLIANW